MFNSIFGGLGGLYQTTATNPQSLQNSISLSQGFQTAQQASLAQQQMNAYAQQMAQQFTPPKWVIAGQRFKTSKDFAEHIWPDDAEARLMFLMKYPDE